jgi:hypothetical protein
MKTLQNVMLINAVSSAASGLLLIFLAGFVSQIFEIPSTGVFAGVGVFLVLFASLVFYESRQIPIRMERIRLIITLDRLWVLLSLIVVLLPSIDMSTMGKVLTIAVAVWVALMAYLQARNLKRVTI